MRRPVDFTRLGCKTIRQGLFVFFISCLIILAGCSERSPKQKQKEAKGSATNIYQIFFYLSGDDFASLDEMEILNRVKRLVVSRGIGEVMNTGSGMGYMTFAFRLQKDGSLDSVRDIVHEVYPRAGYRIEPMIAGARPDSE